MDGASMFVNIFLPFCDWHIPLNERNNVDDDVVYELNNGIEIYYSYIGR